MIDFDFIEWDDEADANGNTRHVAHNGLTRDEVEDVLHDPAGRNTTNRSSGRRAVIGTTSTGKTVIVMYERHKDAGYVTVRPVTAYEID